MPIHNGGNPEKATINNSLEGDHLDAFARADSNILSTEIAEVTYAQIIDGLPISSVALESASDPLPDLHPIHDHHKDLCPGVRERTRGFRERFDPGSLQLDAAVRTIHFLWAGFDKNTRGFTLVSL